MKEGDLVKCINNNTLRQNTRLTLDKVYTVVNIRYSTAGVNGANYIKVICDDGLPRDFALARFIIATQEMRDMKLKTLLE